MPKRRKISPARRKALALARATRFLGVVSDTNRLKILALLRTRRRCVCEIWRALKIPQNLASHHLRVLKDAGLVIDEKVSLQVFYSLQKPALKRQLNNLSKVLIN